MAPIPHDALDALARLEHHDPHTILGVHSSRSPAGAAGLVFRAFHPDAVGVELLLDGRRAGEPMARIHDGGVFELSVPGAELPIEYKYRFQFADGTTWRLEDPYHFMPTLGELDLYFAGQGRHWRLYEKLGAHVRSIEGKEGVSFAVWAPNARGVSVVGDFNRWDPRLCPMRRLGTGIWEIFIPALGDGELYKFAIRTLTGATRMKQDPLAFRTQLRPETSGIVWSRGGYAWGDADWMGARAQADCLRQPMAIYEVHLGSWHKAGDEQRWLNYREAAHQLVEHAKAFGFTHIEFLPLAEHPFDGSWGYQVTGYYAPTSRFGTPDDFKYLVDLLHRNGIGVIIDWVPAHFPKDDWALRRFDGTALYEHLDPRQGEHRDWGTLIFNFGRTEVTNFLVSNALFWLDEYHIDALRVDAVASMLYLDYSRKEGEWIPNKFGGRENLEAVDFLRRLNSEVHSQFPGAFTIAEESTAWPGVSRPAHLGGLGFGLKWNMGWMHDILRYFSKDPVHRSFHHNDLTFSMMYQYSENFVLPFSHDEVVYGKGSLLAKMPGDVESKFANLRTLFAYMWGHPGKKLLFMGGEFGQGREWDHDSALQWGEMEFPLRRGLVRFMQDLGRLYRDSPALWKYDCEARGFQWIDCTDWQNSVVAYLRWGDDGDHLLFAFNLTPVARATYQFGVPRAGGYREVLNSDSEFYGGTNFGNGGTVRTIDDPRHGHAQSVILKLPPLGAVVLKPE